MLRGAPQWLKIQAHATLLNTARRAKSAVEARDFFLRCRATSTSIGTSKQGDRPWKPQARHLSRGQTRLSTNRDQNIQELIQNHERRDNDSNEEGVHKVEGEIKEQEDEKAPEPVQLPFDNLSNPNLSAWNYELATLPVVITFDAFGTLFYPKEPIEVQYAALADKHGLQVTSEDLKASFKKAYAALSTSHPNYGKDGGIGPITWWTNIIRETFHSHLKPGTEVPKGLVTELYTRFATSEGYALFEDVWPILHTIGTRSYSAADWPPCRTMLGVVSNSDPRVRSILNSFAIPILPSLFPPRYAPWLHKHHCDFGPATLSFATLSYEAGASKPNSNIFSAAVRDSQMALSNLARIARLTRTSLGMVSNLREQCHYMHVGDDLEQDVIGAIKAGWDGVLLDRKSAHEISNGEVTIDFPGVGLRTMSYPIINSLTHLARLLSKHRLERLDDTTAKYRARQPPVPISPADLAAAQRFQSRIKRGRHRFYKGRRVVPHPVGRQLPPWVRPGETPLMMYE